MLKKFYVGTRPYKEIADLSRNQKNTMDFYRLRILLVSAYFLSRPNTIMHNMAIQTKGQMISKGLLVSSNSPKKRTYEFVFTTMTISFIRILGEFKDTKQSFRNYLTFKEDLNLI